MTRDANGTVRISAATATILVSVVGVLCTFVGVALASGRELQKIETHGNEIGAIKAKDAEQDKLISTIAVELAAIRANTEQLLKQKG